MKLTQKIKNIPPYIFAEIDKKKAETQAKGIDIVDLGIGDPDLPTPKFIVDAMIRSLQDPATHNYPPYQGTKAFRQAVADWYKKRFNVTLDAETEVISLIGSKEGIAHAFLTFLDPGDVAILPNPGYPVYNVATLIAGGVPYFVPVNAENNYEPDLSQIPADIRKKANVLFLNYPNNPTAACASDAFLESAVKFGLENNILICMDLAYSEVYFDGYRPKSILEFKDAKKIALEFHSLSKTFNMTGWRIGMAVGCPEAVQALGNIKTNVDSGAFKAIQEAAIVALGSKEGDAFIAGQNALYQKRRDILVEGLQKLGCPLQKPKATYYVWAPVPKGMTSAEFTLKALEEAAVLVVPGTGYGTLGEGYFRMSITTTEDRLHEAVRRFEKSGIRF